MVSTDIKGFSILPVQLPGSQINHYIYFKKHDVKGGSETSNRSLFVCNLPVASSQQVLKKYFSDVAIGATIELYVASLLTDYPEDIWINLSKLTSDLEVSEDVTKEAASRLPKNCAVVTFVDKAAFLLAYNSIKKLSTAAKVSSWPLPTFSAAHYLEKFQAQILDPEQLSNEVSQALVEFDRAEKESMESLQRQTQLVDEDGFTLVVGSHRKTKAGILGKQKLAATVELDKANSKLKKKEKEDFYRYQLRQKKKDEMTELLHKFKQDQNRVHMMREKKRFKPY